MVKQRPFVRTLLSVTKNKTIKIIDVAIPFENRWSPPGGSTGEDMQVSSPCRATGEQRLRR